MNYNAASSGSIQVCSISLNMTDRIRLVGVPMNLTSDLREAIQRSWGNIQDEREYHGTHEFKLVGNPWLGNGSEAVTARTLLNAVLATMARHGWNLIQSADVSKKPGDKDTLFFENGHPDPEVQIFGLSFNMGDRIRVIGAPNVVPYIREAITTQWNGRIQKEKDYHGAFEFKLEGCPWWPDGSQAVRSRMLLNQILANLRGLGFKLYGSVDVSTGTEGRDLESWVFRRVGPAWS